MTYNGRVHLYEITEALAEVPGVEVKVRRGLLSVHIPAIGDTAAIIGAGPIGLGQLMLAKASGARAGF